VHPLDLVVTTTKVNSMSMKLTAPSRLFETTSKSLSPRSIAPALNRKGVQMIGETMAEVTQAVARVTDHA
jgi:hypothetical protein